ncbi:unnamed protein product, partial [Symbiodinium sp. CCMP2456]
MLQWLIENERGLDFLCRSVRATFALFAEMGMTVNASKSKLILSIRGGVAKRWLRCKRQRTQQGYVIRLGTPSNPIDIPHVASAVYLGIEISLDNYALRTCKLRMKMAGAIRHRLLKVLHSAGIGLRTRVTLYASCVRSSMFYGQHAVGLSSNILRRLENKDARYLRAISRSPAHITMESTESLRKRLRILSPSAVFCKLLGKRLKACQNLACRQSFSVTLDTAQRFQPGHAQPSGTQLEEISDCEPIACPECGLYFADMRLLRSHQARKHGYKKGKMPTQAEYVRNTVDGMPQCIHCRKVFTRVEGLKKHLRGSCRVMMQQGHEEPEAASDVSGEVPHTREGLLGCSHRAPPAVSAPIALLERRSFRNAVKMQWRSVLSQADYVSSLQQYCVICGRWASNVGGIKQHIRPIHPQEWQHKTEAAARCSSTGLIAESPCHYCKLEIKAPRTHLSIMEQGDQEIAAAARREAEDVFGADPRAKRNTPEPDDSHERKPKWNKPASKGQQSYGKGGYHGSWREAKDPWSYEPVALGTAEQEFLKNVAKMLMRHESEMRLLRQDTTWMLFMDTSEHGLLKLIQEKAAQWQELYQQKKVTSSLRVILLICIFQELAQRLDNLLQDQQKLDKIHTVGWLVEGEQAVNPKWVYQQWSPEKQTVELSTQAPISYSLAREAIQCVINNVGGPGVLLRFRSTRPMTEQISGEVLPFALVLSMRGNLAMQVHQAMGLLTGNACLKVAGLRIRPDRGQQSKLARALEDSYTGLSFADWKPRQNSWQKQRPRPPKTSDASEEGMEAKVPQSSLQNPHNICYLNAASQAFAWIGQLSGNEDICYGLPVSIAWRMLLQGWEGLSREQDVSQFMVHLLEKSKPAAYVGAWQARLSNPDSLVDEGSLQLPIPMDLQGSTIEEIIHKWHEQHSIHAISRHAGIIILWQPGERVAMPFFSAPTGVQIRFEESPAGEMQDPTVTEMPMPAQLYQDAFEEYLLLEAYRVLKARQTAEPLPNEMAMAQRNDILAVAREDLDDSGYAQLLAYADSLCDTCASLPCLVMPVPLCTPTTSSSDADQLAMAILQDGVSSLWSAVRQVVQRLAMSMEPRLGSTVSSQVTRLGASGQMSFTGLTQSTATHRSACVLLNSLVLQLCPRHRWTSLVLSKNGALPPHRDVQNARIPTLLVGLSHYRDGQLWVQDERGTDYEEYGSELVAGRLYDTSMRCLLFPAASLLHCVKPWTEGDRYVLVSAFQRMTLKVDA